MKCEKHPAYTGQRLSKCVRECETCRQIYLETNPDCASKLEQAIPPAPKLTHQVEKVLLDCDAPVKNSPSATGWVVAIVPFGRGVKLSLEQIEIMAKSAIKFGKVTGLGYTSYIKALDYLGLSKTSQVEIIEWLRENGKINKTTKQQEAKDKQRRAEL